MNKQIHTRERGSYKTKQNEAKKTQRPNARIAKSAFTLKQAHTLEEEVQETTATERQDCQNRFRITKTLCTSHSNKHKSSLQIQKFGNTLKVDLSSHKAS